VTPCIGSCVGRMRRVGELAREPSRTTWSRSRRRISPRSNAHFSRDARRDDRRRWRSRPPCRHLSRARRRGALPRLRGRVPRRQHELVRRRPPKRVAAGASRGKTDLAHRRPARMAARP
jgi:hypothetical protein